MERTSQAPRMDGYPLTLRMLRAVGIHRRAQAKAGVIGATVSDGDAVPAQRTQQHHADRDTRTVGVFGLLSL